MENYIPWIFLGWNSPGAGAGADAKDHTEFSSGLDIKKLWWIR